MATKAAPVIAPSDDPPAEPGVRDDGAGEETPEQPKETVEDVKAKLRETEKALKAAERLNEEIAKRDKFWEEREKRAKPSPRTETPVDPDPLEELDVLGLLESEPDRKKISAVLAKTVNQSVARRLKSGDYVSKADMEAYIGNIVSQATEMARLTADFKGLDDPKSEMFAETQKQIALLEQDRAYEGVPPGVIQRLAAQQAKINLIEAGKLGGEADEDRYERIAGQRGGSRGKQRTADDTTLTNAQKVMAAKLGVSEKEYLEGVKRTQLGPTLTAERMAREWQNG